MKILLAAPQSQDTPLGAIGGHCKKALENLGYDLQVFDFRQSQYLKSPAASFLKKGINKIFPSLPYRIPFVNSMDKDKMNSSLLTIAEEYQPDALLVLMGDTILPQTLGKIRKQGTITINWFQDTVLAPMRKDFVQAISPYYDYFFMIDSEDILNYVKVKSRFIKTIPVACNPQAHKNIDLSEKEKNRYGNEVCFVGSVDLRREEILPQLSDFDLGIWGNWLRKIPELKEYYRRRHVYGEEVVKIYNASKIVVDIPLSYEARGRIFCVTPRVFEVSACGAFILTDATSPVSGLYEIGKEIVCYRDEKDLKGLIRYYLSRPEERKRIAKGGQERAYRDHTYEKRLGEIFSIIEKNR